jgi:hypothetical protein
VTWDQRNVGILDRKSLFWLGNQYNNWFDSALAVLEYVRDNYGRLVDQTRLYRDNFFNSTLPWQVLESVAGPISTIRTPTCIWNQDNRFHGFEGCHGASTDSWRVGRLLPHGLHACLELRDGRGQAVSQPGAGHAPHRPGRPDQSLGRHPPPHGAAAVSAPALERVHRRTA